MYKKLPLDTFLRIVLISLRLNQKDSLYSASFNEPLIGDKKIQSMLEKIKNKVVYFTDKGGVFNEDDIEAVNSILDSVDKMHIAEINFNMI